MLNICRSDARGRANHSWLKTRFTFSFAEYHDPDFMGFRHLRVINEDHIAVGKGFPMHPHRDMEIITYVLSGALEHRDDMGNGSVIRHGDVQRMTAGTGVVHSEFNPSSDEETHLLQIWILPDRAGHEPGYEEKKFEPQEMTGRLCLIASPDAADGSLLVHQDLRLFAARLGLDDEVEHTLAPGRHAWLQLARGSLSVGGKTLHAGDGLAVHDEARLTLRAEEAAEFLLFDLA